LTSLKSKISESNKSKGIADFEIEQLKEKFKTIGREDIVGYCDKIIKLQQHYSQAEQNCSTRKLEVEALAKTASELNANITALLQLESCLGYERLKEVPRLYQKAAKEMSEKDKTITDLRDRIVKLQSDQTAKIGIIERMSEENQILIYLNNRLTEELSNLSPNHNPIRFSKPYFRKLKMMTSEDRYVLTTIQELYDTNLNIQKDVHDLKYTLSSRDQHIQQLELEVSNKDRQIAELKKDFETYQNRSHNSDSRNEIGVLEEKKAILNFSIVADENKSLKEDLKKLIEFNNTLNLKVLDLEIVQGRTSQKLVDSEARLKEIIQYYKDSLAENEKLRASTFKQGKEYGTLKAQNESLLREVELFSQKTTALISTISTFSDYTKDLTSLTSAETEHLNTLVKKLTSLFTTQKDALDSMQQMGEQSSLLSANAANLSIQNQIINEKNKLLTFRLEASAAYIQILEEKSKNMETSLQEHFTRIRTLEKERESLEANAALERIKNYLESKSKELDGFSNRMQGLLDETEERRRSESNKAAELALEVDRIKEQGRGEIERLQNEFKTRFESIVEKANSKVREFKELSDSILKERGDEIANLKSRLEGKEFEGRNDMMNQLENLQKHNSLLRNEVMSLEAQNKIFEANISASEEIHDFNSKLIEKTYKEEINSLEKQKEEFKHKLEELKQLHLDSEQKSGNKIDEARRALREYSTASQELVSSLRSVEDPAVSQAILTFENRVSANTSSSN